MITDAQLYNLAILLGSFSMVLIILYHFLEINAKDDVDSPVTEERKVDVTPGKVAVGAGR